MLRLLFESHPIAQSLVPAMEILDKINESLIGRQTCINTPFGRKPLVYADYTASGRSLSFIEDTIRDHVLPFYANTHSDSAVTGAQMNRYYSESKQMIRDSVNASKDDRVVFCGAGATAAVNKLIDLLQLRSVQARSSNDRPVVFIGPYEHHSNELPWRECDVDLCVIPLDATGGICLESLQAELVNYAGRTLKIGSFSAASNVTGRLSDVAEITKMLKACGALSFWDYAAAGPYVDIDMNADAPIDGIYLSPHKFVGGPGTCGVLVAKQHVFTNSVPSVVGGGTVSYVTDRSHDYLKDVEAREEAGTPAIVDAIRTGLVFKLKDQVGAEVIQAKEKQIADSVLARLTAMDQVEVLGSNTAARLPIFSFRIRCGSQYLHYGYVVTLLNDLFGIQTRGGCSCAGPYGHALLGIDQGQSMLYRSRIAQGETIYRPGWVRFNINYFVGEQEMNYILDAIEWVASYGEQMLSKYSCCVKKGVWRHIEAAPEFRSLDWNGADIPDVVSMDHQQLMIDAKGEANNHLNNILSVNPSESGAPLVTEQSRHDNAWFVLPH